MPNIALVVTPFSDENLRLAAQLGVDEIVYYDMNKMPETVEELMQIKSRVESFGMKLGVIEGGPPMDKIVLQKEGYEAQIEHFKACIRNMGKAGIPVLCYNFMPWSLRVGRTSYEVPIRGGALSSCFKWEDWDDSLRTEDGETTHEQMWKNLQHFLNEVVPVAEESGVYLALHPDDPPVERLRGLARIMWSIENLQKLLEMYPSVHNGITFCQGTISEMGVNIPEEIPKFKDRVHFVHFRDVVGCGKHFVETFQDEGQTDMLAALQAWKSIGFEGPIRPDHVPLLEGEMGHEVGDKAKGYWSGKASGYTMLGRLFAVGYMRGLFHAVFGKKQVATYK